MKKWYISSNNWHFTSHIYLEEAPWYIYFLNDSIEFICDKFPKIELPKIKIIRNGKKTDLNEFYGTTADLFHYFICDKVTDWCNKKIKFYSFSFPYFKLKEIFPDEFKNTMEYFDDEEDVDELNRNLEYSKEVGKEFDIVYDKLENIVINNNCINDKI